jgi:acetyltransferase-like isoleucine patch superfamily enzyme
VRRVREDDLWDAVRNHPQIQFFFLPFFVSSSSFLLTYTIKQIVHISQTYKYLSYASFTPNLEASRFKARAWAHKYNSYWPTQPNADFRVLAADRAVMLQEILGKVDDTAFIEPPFHIDYGCNISLGSRFYANFNLTILDCSLVTIGDRVMLGPNVSIFAATHEVEVQSRREDVEYGRPVVIGNDCWIGGHVVILPGVTIGDGCTIAASSVVTRDVPSWSVVRGSPARVVKEVLAVEPTVEEK